MKIKDILPIVEQELRDEYGFEFNDFRLEELYPIRKFKYPAYDGFILNI